MLLYEKSLDYKELKIFECTPDKQKLYKFKKEEMLKIPEDDRIYKAITPYFESLYFERKDTFKYSSAGTEAITGYYEHRLIKYPIDEEELERQRKVLETFYQINDGMHSYILEGWGLDNKTTYFTPLGNYVDNNFAYVLENVIQITKSLFCLEMLLLGEYKMVSDEDLQKYIAMLNFEIKLCKKYNLEDLRELQKYNLLSEPLESIIDPKIKNSKRVLDLVRNK